MSGTWTTDWATNDVVTAAEFRKSLGCVADSTLGGAAASIDFTGLPTTYAHLMVILYGRGDTAAALTNVQCRFNNDSTATYHQQALDATGATVTAADAGAAAVTSALIGFIPAATSPANAFGQLDMVVAHYANAVNQKTFVAKSYAKSAATGVGAGFLRTVGGVWMLAPVAINRITLFPAAGNFAAGTRASVYVMGS